MTLPESEMNERIERVTKQVMAILGEAQAHPRTGRTLPDVGHVPEGASITNLIDHTLLKPDASARQIEKLCFEAREYNFASVCVNSVFVRLAREMLRESAVKVCTVVGFPLGAVMPEAKVYEAEAAIRAGAQEIDMVLHIGALKSRDLVALHEEISEVVTVCHDNDVLCKLIMETVFLDDDEKIIASHLARVDGVDFVKTSTGFSGGGATVADVRLLRRVVGSGVGVKASGGVRDLQTAQAMVQAGANRIGASAGVAIAREERGEDIPPAATDSY
jgi:deoxyribose-phosphate aldolase